MSINKTPTYQSTARGFDPAGNFMQNIAGAFLTKKDFTITDEQLEDNTYLFDAFDNGDVFPLHLVQSVSNNNEETQKITSLQDFDIKLRDGKYKHTLRFDLSNAFHQILDTYSGTDLYIIHYDQTDKLILAESGTDGVYRGVKTDSIILQKQSLFGNGSQPVYSDLDIELSYGEILKVIEVDWLLDDIDKRFLKIDLLYVTNSYITFTAKYNSENITTLKPTDIALTDNSNGDITGIFLNYESGSYKLSNLSAIITTGCLTINANVYLGRTKYRVQAVVEVSNNMTWGDGNNMVFGDGNNMLWAN